MDETICPTCGSRCKRNEAYEECDTKRLLIPFPQIDTTKLRERFKEYIYRTTRPERNLVSISFAVDDVLRAVNELLEQEER